jgi:hypothetical protein
MSQENGDALGAFKANIEGMAETELERLNEQASELQEQLAHVRAQQRSVRAILSATRPARVRGKKKEASKAGVPFKMSDERRADFIDFLRDMGNEEFTTRTVKERFPGWADSYANMTTKLAREEGLIRKAAQSGSTTIYKAIH